MTDHMQKIKVGGVDKVGHTSICSDVNRIAVAFFFDSEGIVDDYMFFLLEEIGKFTSRLLIVINDPIRSEYLVALQNMGVEILIRENFGFDAHAYKAAIEHIGYDLLEDFDELLLFNHTFFGPIFPFEEMFSEMEGEACDFWGITAHKETASPFEEGAEMPWHLQSHFIVVKKRMLQSSHFCEYWRTLPRIETYEESIILHEIRFTEYFRNLGFLVRAYIQNKLYESANPIFDNIDLLIDNRCPIIKRRTFFHDYIYHEKNGVDLPRALRLLQLRSHYNVALIWKNILRSVDLRTLNTNAALTSIFPDIRLKDPSKQNPGFSGKVAVCAHIYYPEMTPYLLALCENIPGVFDLIVTTDTKEKADQIRRFIGDYRKVEKAIVRILDQNRGRDMAAIFVGCRDIFTTGEYDLVCRLHTKKSPQDGQSLSNIFKRHLEENLLNSSGYVQNIFDMFEDNPSIGLAFPPIIHMGYPTLGQAWFTNKPIVERLAADMNINVKLDVDTPVAPYGGMYWFRPRALRKIFDRKWSWNDFEEEPEYHDGDLPHGLERILAYAAQAEGFTTQHIMCKHLAEQNYVSLEYKLQKLGSIIGGTFHQQYQLAKNRSASPGVQISNVQMKSVHNRVIGAWNLYAVKSGMRSSTPVNRVKRKAKAFYYLFRSQRIKALERLFHPVNVFEQVLELFDEYTYVLSNEDIAIGGLDPFRHYFSHGFFEQRDPHPLFSNMFYNRHYLKFNDPGEPYLPLIDYLSQGALGEFSPHPLFDPKYYVAQLSQPIEQTDVPLLHFLREGAARGLNPHPAFETQFYVRQCSDIDFSKLNPLVHYLLFGGFEGRNPNPIFDSGRYLEANSDVARARMNPLYHYLIYGLKEGRRVAGKMQ